VRTLGREARGGLGGGLEEGFEVLVVDLGGAGDRRSRGAGSVRLSEVLVVDLGGASGGVVEFALF